MSILLSEQPKVEGYRMAWDKDKCKALLDIDLYLHISDDFIPIKPLKDAKIGFMKNKDPKVIKLRDKLIAERDADAHPMMIALSEGTTLENFIKDSRISSSSYIPQTPSSIEPELVLDDGVKVDTKEAEGLFWGPGLFGVGDKDTNTIKLPPLGKSSTPAPSVDYMDDIDLDSLNTVPSEDLHDEIEVTVSLIDTLNDLDEEESVIEPEEDILEIIEENDFYKKSELIPPIQATIPASFGDISDDLRQDEDKDLMESVIKKHVQDTGEEGEVKSPQIVIGGSEDRDEKLDDILVYVEDLHNSHITVENLNDIQTSIVERLNDIEKGIYKQFEEVLLNKQAPRQKLSKHISEVERKVIDDYVPNPKLVGFLRSERAFQKLPYSEVYEGLQLVVGVGDILQEGTEGFFEFISKNFPFIFMEYSSILNKVKEMEEIE